MQHNPQFPTKILYALREDEMEIQIVISALNEVAIKSFVHIDGSYIANKIRGIKISGVCQPIFAFHITSLTWNWLTETLFPDSFAEK
jgi:hypothetical protein